MNDHYNEKENESCAQNDCDGAVGCLAGIIGFSRSLINVVTVIFFFKYSAERVAEAPKKIFNGVIWIAIGIVLCLPWTYLYSISGLASY